MKFKSIVCATIALLLTFCLSGCGNEESKLIGTWVYDSSSKVRTDARTLTFYEGGSCANSGESGTWSVSGNTISVMGTYGGQFFSHDNLVGEFKVSGNTLTITNPAVDGDVSKGDLVYKKSNQ